MEIIISNSLSISCNVKIIQSYSTVEYNIPNINVTLQKDNKLFLNDIIDELKKIEENKVNFDNKIILYYDESLKVYIYMGKYPLNNIILIDPVINMDNKTCDIIIKTREIINKNYMLYSELTDPEMDIERKYKKNVSENKKGKRAKERKIGDVIENLYMWRKLFYEYRNKIKGFSLDDAADLIGVSKKSLDDYLIQVKLGKKYNFDFNEHKNDKIGVLRAFTKKNKTNDSEESD